MLRLLRIELHKIIFSKTVLVILGLYLLLIAPAAFGLNSIIKSATINTGDIEINPAEMIGFSLFHFPNIWHNMAYLSSWFQFLLAVVVISLVTNEFSFKTLRQNIIDGMSKWEVIWAKELVILLISLFSVLVLCIITFILGKNPESVSILTGFEYVIAYFLNTFLFLNFAYFLSTLLKRAGLVIGLLLLYYLIIENIIAHYLPSNLGSYLPMNVLTKLVPSPLGNYLGTPTQPDFSPINMGLWGFYLCLFIGLNYWMLKRGHAGK